MSKFLIAWIPLCFSLWGALSLHAGELNVTPSRVVLDGSFAQAQIVVQEQLSVGHASERYVDRTREAVLQCTDSAIATVSSDGCVRPIANGTTTLLVAVGEQTVSLDVEVRGVTPEPDVDFHRDILPVLTRSGCNAGSCHASQYGKGGLVLSVMAFDPIHDYQSLALSARGRRLNATNPHESLLLKKATNAVAHGGGVRFSPESSDYRMLARWIATGAPQPTAQATKVKRLELHPAKRIASVGEQQQLRVVATYEDGVERDVTAWTRFDAMDEGVVHVSFSGLTTTQGKGQGAVMARFADHAEIATFVVPFSEAADLTAWQSEQPLDQVAEAKFRELGLTPSGLCDDATFMRRVYLDALGALPSVEESRAFLASQDPEKRDRLIDRVLGLTGDPNQDIHNDQFSGYWALKWADLIRNNSAVLGESGMWALHNWLRESFRTNKPMDRFVQELITAKGSIFSNGPANYYRIANNPSDLAESTAQLFLGTRLQCAKCHHHPYERLSQADYYGFASFFSRVASKTSAEFGIFGGETVVMVISGGEVVHPKTGAVMKPTTLEGEVLENSDDRRIALAEWLTRKDNAWFARNIVNRYVAYLLGRGLVEPIDDLRSTNPPSSPAMMELLVAEFRHSGFDVRQLMRTLMRSRLYQLDSQPSDSNAEDERFYSHYRVKRIAAEPLLDCIDDATASRTKHPNLPLGKRAIDLPDAASASTHPFLLTFGKPKRSSVCECERTPDENLAQALHTLNGDVLATKVADANGRVAQLIASGKSVDECVEELYLATLCRFPSTLELAEARQFVASCPSTSEGYQDLLWALINTKQFLFIR